jgi:hypothetical protein
MPGTLLAAIATPMPVPQSRIARSASPAAIFLACSDGHRRVRRPLEIFLEHAEIGDLDPIISLHIRLRSRPGDLVHREGARDTTPLGLLLPAGRGHVVGHIHNPGVDAFIDQSLAGDAEVQSVPGIVAEGEDHPRASIRRPGDPVDLLRRGRGKDVAEHRTVREPRPHHTVIGREVAGAPADHEADLALQRSTGTNETRRTVDTLHILRVRRREALDHVILELGWVVIEIRHESLQGWDGHRMENGQS